MDKIKKYQNIILDYFQELKDWQYSGEDCQFITDVEHQHFQIMSYGWNKEQTKYVTSIIIHYQIKPDGKIWIIENKSEEDVAQALTERGAAKEDIVLAFLPQRVRQHTGYAMV